MSTGTNKEAGTAEQSKQEPLPLGACHSTPGALEAAGRLGVDVRALLRRHQSGDWGDLDRHDWEMNDRALREGGRVLSSYRFAPGVKIWIITEGDRSHTTVMMPDEY